MFGRCWNNPLWKKERKLLTSEQPLLPLECNGSKFASTHSNKPHPPKPPPGWVWLLLSQGSPHSLARRLARETRAHTGHRLTKWRDLCMLSSFPLRHSHQSLLQKAATPSPTRSTGTSAKPILPV